MSNIPTAKDFLNRDESGVFTDVDITKAMIEFAKLHVKAAQEAWFVKNPSCEEVEVGYGWIRLTETDNEGYWVFIPDKQFEMQQEEPKALTKLQIAKNIAAIGISKKEEPKDVVLGYKTSLDAQMLDGLEEPKQETLEEAAEKQEAFVFTPEQLNQFISNVIKDTLDTAAEKAYALVKDHDLYVREYVGTKYSVDIDMSEDSPLQYGCSVIMDKESITNTFDITYKKHMV